MGLFFPDAPQPSSRRNVRWFLIAWLPAMIGIAVICIESTGTFSAENTSGWLRPIFERIFGVFQDERWALFHHYARKAGHFLGYGTLGLAFLRAWLFTLKPPRAFLLDVQTLRLRWRLRATALAIACTALVASCDEYHQSFLPSRTGVPSDVLLDTMGACILCALAWLICFRGAAQTARPLPADA